jgi:hypothetical protein
VIGGVTLGGAHGGQSRYGELAQAVVDGKRLQFFSRLHVALGTPRCCGRIFFFDVANFFRRCCKTLCMLEQLIFYVSLKNNFGVSSAIFFMLQFYVYNVIS